MAQQEIEAEASGLAKLSAAQREAASTLDRSLCVSAGAGSGKTTVLVERYIHIVTEKEIDPERIVAITYTEKAANHLKEKLISELSKRGMHPERRAVESAYIGTIHSFAARLLRENPVEAGVDPQFAVLEPAGAGILMDEAIENAFETCAESEAVLQFLVDYGYDKAADAIRKIYGKLRSSGLDRLFVRPADMKPVERDLKKELEALAATKGANAKAAADVLVRVKRAPDWEALSEIRAEAKFRADGEVKALVTNVRDLLKQWTALTVESFSGPAREAFSILFESAVSRFEMLKKEARSLDFDDLLLLCFELLTAESAAGKRVRLEYQRKFEHILVDEFQDTSPLQTRIIERLARKDNLFIVGDAKQSIYRFRNADLREFLKKEKEIEAGGGGRIPLAENYRSRPEIINFVNAFFERVWAEDGFRFEPLVAKRTFPAKTVPSVECLWIEQAAEAEESDEESEETESMEKARAREARVLAARIKELIEKERIEVTLRDGTARKAEYGDIAILFRRMTGSAVYERELQNLDIPYFVVKGTGFYEKQEIRDLMYFLALLERPESDIPLATVLRSPLAGLSDDALFWLSRIKEKTKSKETPLFKGLFDPDSLKRLADADRESLTAYLSLYEDLRKRKDSMSVAEMLEEVLARTGYDLVLTGEPGGRRKYANVMKLIELARTFHENQTFGLAEFISYIRKIDTDEARESEAQLEMESGNTVKILTVHKAKGLEFPIVAVADLGARPKGGNDSPFNFSSENGLGIKLKNPATGTWEESYTFLMNKESDQAGEREELKRVMYVALTRAEEHLIVSGAGKTKKDPQHLEKRFHDIPVGIDWFRKALPLSGIELKRMEEPRAAAWKKKSAWHEQAPFAEACKNLSPVAAETDGIGAYLDVLSRVEKPYFESISVPVTAVLQFMECPGCYYDRYVLAMPLKPHQPEGELEEAGSEWEDERVSRREFGLLFHGVMRSFRFAEPRDGEIDRCLDDIKAWTSNLDLQEIDRSLRTLLQSEWGRTLQEAAKLYRETPFILRVPNGDVKGQIDALIEEKDGNLTILDYKTNRIADDKMLADKIRQYRPQLLIYALAVRERSGILPRQCSLYFTSRNQTKHFVFTEAEAAEARAALNATLAGMRDTASFKHADGCTYDR